MKILITGDEHLYLRIKGVDKDWLSNRFEKFISLLNDVPHDCRVHLGDYFDTVPTIEELAIFLKYANGVTRPTYMIDGNHEATKKGSTFLTHIKTMITNPLFRIIDAYTSLEFGDFLPYCDLKDFVKHPDRYPARGRILFTHVRGEIPPHVHAEIPLELLDSWQLVFAGDLHSYKNSQRNILYPGSPMSTSRSRSIPRGTHGYFILDDVEDVQWHSLDDKLPHLLRLPLGATVDDTYHNVVYEATVEHASETVEVAGKKVEKIVKEKESVSSLGLTKASKFEDYMVAYMKQRLSMEATKITKVMTLYGSIT